ncbi:DNA excision repair protein ERCC-6-like [Ptychodera flava]|uniref:DNA excision repair protein ERCC-6-like n=1 Tax=Ptychodera flava TaxID=63121 RepID=UPI00396A43E1
MEVITGDIENTARKLSSVSIGHHSRSPLKENQSGNIKSHHERHGSDLTEEEQLRYNKLVKKSKTAAQEGNAQLSVELLYKAAKLQNSEKIQRRIKKLEDWIKEYENDQEEEEVEEEDDNGMARVCDGFYLHKDVAGKLFSYQKDGIKWFWGLHKKKVGGILGDDMGLGKTIQVIGFLCGLFDAERVKSVLIVMPASLIINWEKEFDKWAPGVRVMTYHGSSKRERERALTKVQRRGGVLLTTYGIVTNNWQELGTDDMAREFVWDYVILDEGHKIKNTSIKSSKAVHAIAARRRFILTGTPIQNNLKELWALIDFVTQGQLLGTQKTFSMEYEGPIVRAREKDATACEKRLGNEMAESLRNIIAPYFLRRTKAETLEKNTNNPEADKNKSNEEDKVDGGEPANIDHKARLTRKNDFILWVFLSDVQQKIYRDMGSTDEVRELLMTNRSPLAMLNVLKKICDHPRLLSKRACSMLNLEGEENSNFINDEASEMALEECAANDIQHISNESLTEESGKMVVLVKLLGNLRSEGHRTLVFSQSKKMLDIVQKVLVGLHFKVMRMDGTIRKLEDRERIIRKFQKDPSYEVFLLTTGVGGVGLTLTAADRVVIFDPSWNPATDNQAVDRAYRIGQKKSVVIYRLISCGSVEEKIYRRQIFKDSITRQATGSSKDPFRYFTRQELRELFVLDDPHVSTTQMQLQELHSSDRESSIDLDEHIAFLHSLDVFGISDHDLMFSQEDQDHGERDDTVENYVQEQVRKAKELLTGESSMIKQLNENIRQNTEFPSQSQDTQPHRRLPEPPFIPSERNGAPRFKPNRLAGKKVETVDLTMMEDDDSGSSHHGSPKTFVDLTIQPESSEEEINQSMANLTIQESSPETNKGERKKSGESSVSAASSNDIEFHTVDDIPASDIPKPANPTVLQSNKQPLSDNAGKVSGFSDGSTKEVSNPVKGDQCHPVAEGSFTERDDFVDAPSRPCSAMSSAEDDFQDSCDVLPHFSSLPNKEGTEPEDDAGKVSQSGAKSARLTQDSEDEDAKSGGKGWEINSEEMAVHDCDEQNHDDSFSNIRRKHRKKAMVISDEEDSDSHSDSDLNSQNHCGTGTPESNSDAKLSVLAGSGASVLPDEQEDMDISSIECGDADKSKSTEASHRDEDFDNSFDTVKIKRKGRRGVIDSDSDEDDSEGETESNKEETNGDVSIKSASTESEKSEPQDEINNSDDEDDNRGEDNRAKSDREREYIESSSCESVEIDSKTCQVSITAEKLDESPKADNSGDIDRCSRTSTRGSIDDSGSEVSVEVHCQESQVNFPSPGGSAGQITDDEEERKMEEILSKSVCLNEFSSDEEENQDTPKTSFKPGLKANSSAKRRRSSCHIRYMSLKLNSSDEDAGASPMFSGKNKTSQNSDSFPFILDSDDEADLESIIGQINGSGEKFCNMTFVSESPLQGEKADKKVREDEDEADDEAFVQETPENSPVPAQHKSYSSGITESPGDVVMESGSDGENSGQSEARQAVSDSDESFESAQDDLSEDEGVSKTSEHSIEDEKLLSDSTRKKKQPRMIDESCEEDENEEEDSDDDASDVEDSDEDDTDEDVEESYADDEEDDDDESLDGFIVHDDSIESDEEEDDDEEEEDDNGEEGDDGEEETLEEEGEESDSCEVLSDEAKTKYKKLVSEGRKHQKNGDIEGALKSYLKALDISGHDSKLQKITLELYKQFKWRS